MDLRVAVHLARRGEQEPRALPLRETERVVGPVRADLQRQQRQAQVVDRARNRRQVEDDLHGPVELERLDHVVVRELEVLAPKVIDVSQRRGLEVVHADHVMPLGEQVVAQVRADEPGAAGDHDGAHGRTG
jgi:hypothetical protein